MRRYVVDREGLIGEVVDEDGTGNVRLRPPGGGAERACSVEELRPPTAEELERARTYATPVRKVVRP